MNWRTVLARALRLKPDAPQRRTVIHTADWDRPPRGHVATELTEDVIRTNEGESWQPPPPARRDGRRPRSDRW
jgi:hypothetical protein